ncbi:glycosyltransferase family 2 protein [Thermoanaerobacterium sp. RBIITD]|uniref:glycosyltransferase family 2 protein n=1 Tax=Thermoanaerobacterium sp. RBIITD TaxID=1550240 RepID=UPI000BB7ABDF|nr:glycosyltransferase family 2 protein [Thermoanaerobacterium sp. RBIITD]
MCQLVTAIITSYNSNENFLKQAIESVVNQTYSNLEVILVDDGSTNNVAKKIAKLYPNIKYIYQSNRGLASARNTGINNSKGELICFLDDDDIWEKDKVSRQVNFFNAVIKNDSSLGLIFTYQKNIDEKNNFIGTVEKNADGFVFDKILFGNIIGAPSSVMIKREVFEYVGLFNEEFRYAEDIELWYRITRKYNIYSLNEYLLYYRVRKNSLSKNLKMMNKFCEKAFLDTIQRENDYPLIKKNREKIISNYYMCIEMTRNFAFNNASLSRNSYMKALKYNPLGIFKIKYLLKFLFSFLGDNLLIYYNNIKHSV